MPTDYVVQQKLSVEIFARWSKSSPPLSTAEIGDVNVAIRVDGFGSGLWFER
jgi:hypothetical protein